jgi:Family of unknown function (DUF6519)
MKGDFSRLRFSPSKNYVAVLQQQGRVALDADANEQCAIDDYLRDTETRDFVGPWGGPRRGWGFKIGVQDTRITISKGRYYVEGKLVQNDDLLNYSAQPFLMNPSPTDEKLLSDLRQGATKVIQVYLEVWRRLVTALDDPCLLEPALGQADTTVRLQTVWRVVAEAMDPNAKSSASATSAVDNSEVRRTQCIDACCSDMTHLTLPGTTGEMMVPPIASSDDCSCQPTPAAGYRGVENQLYRVEIHETGDETSATFKWSRENGSIVVGVTATSGTVVSVDRFPPDANLGFASGEWVELTDDTYEFGQDPNQPGLLYQIDSVTQDQLYVTLKQAVPGGAVDPTKNARMRRWDQFGSSAGSNGVSISVGSPVPLENGIEVQFTPGQHVSGDYWLIPARTARGEVEWPPCGSDGNPFQPPHRIEIYRAPLACIQWDDKNGTVVHDCRSKFPPLTEITASDVWYNPGCPDLESACNVQQAIDILCNDARGPCTIVPKPGAGWEAPLLALPAGADADICFPIGQFPLTTPVLLKNLGNLRIGGGGLGTVIAGTKLTAAMIFAACKSVQISDLYASTDRAMTRTQRSAGNAALLPGGTLSFVDCPDVGVENVWLQCAYGAERTTACISVENTITPANQTTGSGHVRIRHCNLSVGRNQDGILLVQVERAEVEDNILTTYTPKTQTFGQRLQDRTFRANAMRELIAETEIVKAEPAATAAAPGAAVTAPTTLPKKRSKAQAPAPPEPAAAQPAPAPPAPAPAPVPPVKVVHLNTTVTVGNRVVTFRTNPLLKDFWQSYVTQNGPKEFATDRDLILFVKKAALQFLLHPKTRAGNSGLASVIASIERVDQTAMARGIAVGGEGVQECRILNNSVQDAVQGITVGMSNHKLDPMKRESASVVTIAGNQVYVGLPPGVQFHTRHAIFVGNVDSAVIENNYAKVNRSEVTVEAIRIWGLFGRRLIVRHSHLVGFNTGILIRPLTRPKNQPLWLVADNMAENANSIVLAPANVIQQNNFS